MVKQAEKQKKQQQQVGAQKQAKQQAQQEIVNVATLFMTDEELAQATATGTFAEAFLQQPVEKDAYKPDKNEAYPEIKDRQKASVMQSVKRANIAAEKVNVMTALREGKKIWLTREKMDEDAFYAHIRAHYGTDADELFKMPEELKSMYGWFMNDQTVKSEAQKKKITAGKRFGFALYRRIEGLDPGEFAFRTDKAFADSFPENYAFIRQVVSVWGIYRQHLAKGGEARPELEEKLNAFSKLREEYEERMDLFTSPYYALLSGKDMSALDESDLPTDDPKFMEYLDRYKKLSEKPADKT